MNFPYGGFFPQISRLVKSPDDSKTTQLEKSAREYQRVSIFITSYQIHLSNSILCGY